MESAIPPHLQVSRVEASKMPENYTPPNSAYCARFATDIKDLVIAILGSQHAVKNADSDAALRKLLSFTGPAASPQPPRLVDIAAVTDARGKYNQCLIAYWSGLESYRTWAAACGFDQWWKRLQPEQEQHGWYLEICSPSLDRFETIFSDHEVPEGAAHMRESVSGPVLEHVYWGSMRDRLPASQSDALVGHACHEAGMQDPMRDRGHQDDTTKQRVQIPGKPNLCVIRSGQDWSDTLPEERKLYLETMHPVLETGMNFLRDRGQEIGCHSCRLMEVLSRDTFVADGEDKTFGLAYFDDLASLETWSREHPTHRNIFGGFLKYVEQLHGNITLRLFHEVMVLTPEQQYFEYIGCHPQTGMLGSLARL